MQTNTQPVHSNGTSRSWSFLRAQRITRADDQPYLWRLILFRCPWFAVYLHVFLGDDDLCEHDHPWPFLSVILWGGYWEIASGKGHWYPPGSILFRRATWRHRVKRGHRRTPVTFVITGRKCRRWGFWTHTGVWIPWRQYSSKVHCN